MWRQRRLIKMRMCKQVLITYMLSRVTVLEPSPNLMFRARYECPQIFFPLSFLFLKVVRESSCIVIFISEIYKSKHASRNWLHKYFRQKTYAKAKMYRLWHSNTKLKDKNWQVCQIIHLILISFSEYSFDSVDWLLLEKYNNSVNPS